MKHTDEAPRNAEHIAAMLEGRGDQNEVGDGPKVGISLRLPVLDLAWVDALAARLGKPRTFVIHLCIEVAQQEITSRMSAEALEQLHAEFQNRALALVETHDKEGK